MELAGLVIANLAGILIAFAVLISVIKGNFKLLNEKVDGHLGNMIEAVKNASKIEGKVDALIQSPPSTTTVIHTEDRRKDNFNK